MAKKVAHGQKSGAWPKKRRKAKKVLHGQKSGAWPKKWHMTKQSGAGRGREWPEFTAHQNNHLAYFTPLDRGKGEDGSTAPLLSTFATFHQF